MQKHTSRETGRQAGGQDWITSGLVFLSYLQAQLGFEYSQCLHGAFDTAALRSTWQESQHGLFVGILKTDNFNQFSSDFSLYNVLRGKGAINSAPIVPQEMPYTPVIRNVLHTIWAWLNPVNINTNLFPQAARKCEIMELWCLWAK